MNLLTRSGPRRITMTAEVTRVDGRRETYTAVTNYEGLWARLKRIFKHG